MTQRSEIDATLYIAPDGSHWCEPHWFEATGIDDPLPRYRVVQIADGSRLSPPLICNVLPDRSPE